MAKKATKAATATAGHVPRRGLYALVDQWRTRDDDWHREYRGADEDERHTIFEKHMASDKAYAACADALERAIAQLPIDQQHLQAMLEFDYQSAQAVRDLQAVAVELVRRQDTVNALVNNLLVEFNRLVPEHLPGRKRA